MIQTEFWMLTPLILYIFLKIPVISAEDKNQRKINNQNDNYIITHYGREYYTPATESADIQVHGNSGFFTAEVIPVDINTGEELKTVKNLYVPLHTGYSIGANNNLRNANRASSEKNSEISGKTQSESSQAYYSIPNQYRNKENLDYAITTKDDVKSKIPKKFKDKLKNIKKLPAYYSEDNTKYTSNANFALKSSETIQNEAQKKNMKRNVGERSVENLPSSFTKFNNYFNEKYRRPNYFKLNTDYYY